MNSERWNLIKELFGKALELDAGHRAAFLDEACQDDISLRSEIETLIASHDEAGDFIEKPLYESAPELLDIHPPGESLAGKQLGPYSVIKELGQGGMGVVYLAEDTRLKRLVSMKALAPEFTGDEQHRERLRREARATAALSHPGVATVYSLDEFGGTLFIVGEFVEGESLKSEVSRSPLPQSLFFATALELAEALAAAHDKNLVHRDLKPENIMRNKDGRIKILDFGLARFQSRDACRIRSRIPSDAHRLVFGNPGLRLSRATARPGRRGIQRHLFAGHHTLRAGHGNAPFWRKGHRLHNRAHS